MTEKSVRKGKAVRGLEETAPRTGYPVESDAQAERRRDVGGRLRAIREDMRLSQRDAASRFGVALSTWQSYEAGASEPGILLATRVCVAAGADLNWLTTGLGSMAIDTKRIAQRLLDEDRAAEFQDFIRVKRYDVRVSAGPGAIAGDENVRDFLAFRADFVRTLGINPERAGDDLFCFDAVGDSMAPLIQAGDTLTFVRIAGALPSDGIFALGIGDALVVKRVQPVLGGLMLLSDNPAYKPETLSIAETKEVRALGRLKVISRVV